MAGHGRKITSICIQPQFLFFIIILAFFLLAVFFHSRLPTASYPDDYADLTSHIFELQEKVEILEGNLASRISVDLHESTISNLNKEIDRLKGKKDRNEKQIRRLDEVDGNSPASYSSGVGSFKYPFTMGKRSCHLHLGGCHRVGCDGAVWLSTLFCEDGWSQRCAVKFHKDKDENFSNDTSVQVFLNDLLEDWKELYELFTETMAYVMVPLGALRDSTDQCTVVNLEEVGRKCHKLYDHQYDKPQQNVRGFVMPIIHEGWCNMAYTNLNVRQQALNIVYDLTTIFSKMYGVNTLHCDMNWAHISISQNEHRLGIVPRLFDFSRMKKCVPTRTDCANGLRAQSYQFGSLIIDLCTKTKKCFPTASLHYIHSMGPCKKSEMSDTDAWMKRMEDEIDQSEVQNRITNDWICPHKRLITEAIQTVYSWTWNRENPDWRMVRKKLKKALDSTDFEY